VEKNSPFKTAMSIGFAIAGLTSWYDPSFNGFLSEGTSISAGDGRIVGAIFFIGAAVVWFMPER
jgi:hypothetical protein